MRTKTKRIILAVIFFTLITAAALVVIISRNAGDTGRRLEKAARYLEDRKYDKAISIYNSILMDDDECAEAYAGLSDVYIAQADEDMALDILEEGYESTYGSQIVIDRLSLYFPEWDYDTMYAENDDDDYYDEDDEYYDDDDYYDDEFTDDEDYGEDYGDEDEDEDYLSEDDDTDEYDGEDGTYDDDDEYDDYEDDSDDGYEDDYYDDGYEDEITTEATAAPAETTAPPKKTKPKTTTEKITETEAPVMVEIPDFTLMTIDQVYKWCAKNKINPDVTGTGDTPFAQSPAPGTFVEENSDVIIRC